MKITFLSQHPDFERYKLGDYNVKRVPQMSDEDVARANSTRKLPPNYYVMTCETNYCNKNGTYRSTSRYLSGVDYRQPVITIIKGKKNYPQQDKPQYYETLPDGFELENTICGTYMKKSGVKHVLFNSFRCPIYVGCGAVLGILFNHLFTVKK